MRKREGSILTPAILYCKFMACAKEWNKRKEVGGNVRK
jgi:hypothetical protein